MHIHSLPPCPHLQGDRAPSTLSHVKEALQAAADHKADVDPNGSEEGPGHGLTVGRVLDAAHKLLVVVLEGQPQYREDDDAEYGDDEARPCLHGTDERLHVGRLAVSAGLLLLRRVR